MGFKLYRKEFPVEALEVVEYEGVKFFYRPMLVSDMDAMKSIDKESPTDALMIVATHLIERVEGLEEEDGTPITVLDKLTVEVMPLQMANSIVSDIMKASGVTKEEENFSGPQSDTK